MDEDEASAEVSGQIHTCSVCATKSIWGPSWSWYGSYRQIDDGDPVKKFCSAKCADEYRNQVSSIAELEATLAKRKAELGLS